MRNGNRKRVMVLVIGLVAMTLMSTGCNSIQNNEQSQVSSNAENTMVEIEMQDGSKMVLELYPNFAPETVQNFIDLVESGFYDGLKFHRIIQGFMIQGGDPNGDGTGGAEKSIKGEFAENGFSQNTLEHTKGVISMARSGDPDSASSQFFIMDGDGGFLNGKYAAFGRLIEGETTLEDIANTPVELNPYSGEVSTPTEDRIIKKITVVNTSK